MKTAVAWVIFILLVIAGIWYYMTMKPAPTSSEQIPEEQGAAEVAPAPEDTVTGSWRSTTDPNFTREFSADGKVTDRYEGDESATVTGTWEIILSASLPQIGLPQVEGTILRVQFPEEALYFLVNSDTDADTLSLTYLTGNGVLTFERI